ncbi:MAG TPA: MFS transporter [Candidatus Limnocylindrales bacterium]|nr:MFS transporter [Candidatus Limnocylindrales bacterium]
MAEMAASQPTESPAGSESTGRPTRALPMVHLLNISVYWLGINVIWAGLGYAIFQARFTAMFGETLATGYAGLLETVPLIVAVLVQPTIAAISDYTVSRWGRRKPYIVIGAVLDVVFLLGIAIANDFVSILAFVMLLQFSSNFAQGPFQGYVPDLVPEKQVGTASGLMGLMIIAGQVVGVGIATLGMSQLGDIRPLYGTPEGSELARQAFFLPTLGLAVIEFVTMIPLVLFVREGRAAPDRGGRTWRQIALGAWGTDILNERSYVWLLVSRLFFLACPTILTFMGFFYLVRTLGIPENETGGPLTIIAAIIGVTTAITTIPAAKLSDRIGRKKTIYIAIGLGMCGMAGAAVAPSFPFLIAALLPVGVSAGAFLAVDWALMTDIIPKQTSGRYMGISNVATGLSGPLGRISAGVLVTLLVLIGMPPELRGIDDAPASQSSFYALGPRIAIATSLVFFAISAWALRHVDERRRED